MNIFRLFLLIIALSVIGYTLPVIQSEGILILLPTFFGEMNNLNWQGQFNLDFLTFLLMSAFWTAWRNKFTLRGNLLAIGAFFLGAPYLAIYLIWEDALPSKKINAAWRKIVLTNIESS